MLAELDASARRTLGVMLYTLLVVLPVALAAMVHGSTQAEIHAVGVLLAAVAILVLLYRLGRTTAALYGLVAALVASGTLIMAAFGSIRSAGMLCFVAAIVVSGIFFARAALVATVGACAALVAALIFAESEGWLRRPDFATNAVHWVIYVAALVAIAANIEQARNIAIGALRRARRDEDRLARVLRNSPAALVVSSLEDGRIHEVNDAHCRIFGLPEAESLGRTRSELSTWADAAEREAYLRRLETEGRVENLPVRLRRASGEAFDALISGERVVVDGDPRVVSAITDISREAAARRAHEASEARFRHLFEASPAATSIFTIDEGRIVDCNPAYEALLGRPRAAIVGRTGRELGIWRDPSERTRAREALARDGAVRDFAADIVSGSGEVRRCLFSWNYYDVDGERLLLAHVIDITARQRAEDALRASEERFHALFRSSPVALVVEDCATRAILHVNEAAERMFREEGRAVLGRDPGPRFWTDAAARDAIWSRLQRDGAVQLAPARMRRADGEAFEALVSVALVAQAGESHAIFSVVDVSAEREALARQRASEERFAKAFQHSPIGMTITRLRDGAYLEVNEADERTLGYRREELTGLDTIRAGTWRDAAQRERFVAQLKRDGRVFGYETQMRNKWGQMVDARIYASIVEFDGEPCVLASTINVTEQKRQEAQLLEVARGVSAETGEAFFRRLVEHLGRATGADRVLVGEVADGGSRVRAVARMVDGIAASAIHYDLAGTPCERVLEFGDVLVFEDGVAERFPSDRPLAEAGVRGYIGAPLLDAEGRPVGILNALSRRPLEGGERIEAVFRIFAARAQAELIRLQHEREIMDLNESLERRVRERTAELEAANRELEAFSYSVSHDLRAPLRAMDGFARMVLEDAAGALDDLQRQRLERVISNAGRMNQLIEDLLAMGRIGRQAMQVAPVDLSALAAEVVEGLRHREPARDVHVEIEPGVAALADPSLLRVVVENLVGNAWKFTGRRADARIAIGREAKLDGQPVYVVRDNGAGFDPNYAGRLFEPFQRLHGRSEFEGTGIGLATVHRIVTRHGGRIWAESAPGHGATFRFTLAPAGAAARPAAAQNGAA